MKMTERRDLVRRAQALWASERLAQKRPRIASFDIVSLTSGKTIGHADDHEHVIELAEDYRQNPDLSFVGIDEDGRESGVWTLPEVLNGTFAAETAS